MSILRGHRGPAAVARFGLAPLRDSLWGALLLNSTIEIRAAARLPQPKLLRPNPISHSLKC